MKTAGVVLLSSVLLLGLVGCSGSTGLTVTRSSVAHAAAGALQKELGAATPPPMKCGKGDVSIKIGTKIDCAVTDTSVNQTFDAVVTITKLSGTNYSLHVQVAKTPNN